MAKSFWRKQHKWFGLALCFFMLMFSLSGIILNHRAFYSKVNVSRALLPPYYKYADWNAGLLRGTLRLDSASTIIYGYSGLWLHQEKAPAASPHSAPQKPPVLGGSVAESIADLNAGLPAYADYRVIRNVLRLNDSTLMAVGQYGLYRRSLAEGKAPTSGRWETIPVEKAGRERFTDLAARGDSIVLLSRDRLYLSLPPYRFFRPIDLPAPDNYDGRVSLFRVVWLLHSGEFFGLPGRIVLDLLALAMLLLSLSGLFFWLCPKFLKRKPPVPGLSTARSAKKPPVLGGSVAESRPLSKAPMRRFIKANFLLHKRLGEATFAVMLFVVITGWCLRPPMLIPLALSSMPGINHTAISPHEPWKDKLRAIRYDAEQADWLLSSSDGFFSLEESLQSQPKAIPGAPHVSVMGINVFQKDCAGQWLVGSLSGMWRWDRTAKKATDYFTAEPMPEKAGSPFGKTPVAGFSSDFSSPIVAEYYDGVRTSAADSPPARKTPLPTLPSQPNRLRNLPMSLWQLALEVHTGRLYHLFGLAPLVWIFLAGLAAIWVLISGWKLRR